ncbi:DMT family transporter [Tepidamorphus sp. 3E244]|uniref:DMT family transporter n=1 Tax=Tepidamorphus sp. 3E244 TaxID=3385498 RepID=UPI0038FC6A97
MASPAEPATRAGVFSHPYLLLTLTALFWGGNAVAGKLAAGSIPPLTLTAVRWAGAAILIFLLARPHLAKAMPVLRQRWRFLFLAGAIGFTLFNSALYGALHYTSAINVSIEQAAMPMMIILISFIVFREPITLVQGVGVIVSIVGVLLTATHGDLGMLVRMELNLGDAIMLLAVVAYSGYSVALRKKPDLPWQVLMFALALSAAISALPGLAYDLASGRYPTPSPVTFGVLAYVVLFPSLLAQIFYMRSIQMIGANRAGAFFNLVPVFGAALAVIVLGESVEIYQAIGLVLVIGGIALAERSAHNAAARAPGGE